jgi:prepilin-type N-terminal cleavage/methylation domain-containing protein
MKHFNKQYQAFSLVELVVVMLLSGIVLGMVYYSFHVTQIAFNQFIDTKEKQENFQLMNLNLELDFFRSDSIIYKEQKIYFYCKSELTLYELAKSGIYRDQKALFDTLLLNLEIAKFFFDGVETQNGRIDELLVDYSLTQGSGTLHFMKHYDAVSTLSFIKKGN